MNSAIYSGNLRHRRFWPKQHHFNYAIKLFYLDLAELPHLFDKNHFASSIRRNLLWFNRRDYFGDHNVPIEQAVRNYITHEKGYCPQGPIRLLTQLRIWGFCFNPISFYFIFETDQEKPRFILAQVNNTPWNQRHTYLLECDAEGKVKSQFEKLLHVSPFNPLAMNYRWISSAPDKKLLIHMENHHMHDDGNKKHMDATLVLMREPWSPTSINRIILLQPWTAIKVPLAIYWQAFKLFLKRVPFYSNPHTDNKTLN